MSFRKIHPSTTHTNRLEPNLGVSDMPDGPDAASDRGSSIKRRRAPNFVTKNACLNCKKSRAKCDGNEPCQRCSSRGEALQCIYETNLKNVKEDLIKKINQQNERIQQLQEEGHVANQILHALSADENVREMIDTLQNKFTDKDTVNSLNGFLARDLEASSSLKSLNPMSAASNGDTGALKSTFEFWTSVIPDSATIDHLLQLYFTHVHPIHSLFHKEHFINSRHRHSEDFCSSILVDALCAMACSVHPPNSNGIDYVKLGQEFSDNVKAEIDSQDPTVTTVQAFAVMFLVDLSCSNALRAASYLRTASEILAKVEMLEIDGFQEVWYDTVRGLHNLTIEWAQMTFQVPSSIDIPSTPDEAFDELDKPITQSLHGSNLSSRSRNSASAIFSEKSTLIDIIEDVISMMYSAHGPQITALQVLQQYDRFLAWHDELSRTLARTGDDGGRESLHILSLQILYFNSVVQLLRPLLDLEGFPRASVEDKIQIHARHGLLLLKEYYRLTNNSQSQPALQLFAALHLIDVVVRFPPLASGQSRELGLEAMSFGFHMLVGSQDKSPIAGPFHAMLIRTANECGISIAEHGDGSINDHLSISHNYRQDDIINACTKHTYVQPVKNIHRRYSSSFLTDWASYGSSFGFQSVATGNTGIQTDSTEDNAQPVMEIHNLLN